MCRGNRLDGPSMTWTAIRLIYLFITWHAKHHLKFTNIFRSQFANQPHRESKRWSSAAPRFWPKKSLHVYNDSASPVRCTLKLTWEDTFTFYGCPAQQMRTLYFCPMWFLLSIFFFPRLILSRRRLCNLRRLRIMFDLKKVQCCLSSFEQFSDISHQISISFSSATWRRRKSTVLKLPSTILPHTVWP